MRRPLQQVAHQPLRDIQPMCCDDHRNHRKASNGRVQLIKSHLAANEMKARAMLLRNKQADFRREVRQDLKNNDCDEDLNGPYNFRKLLRPAEYLPTESLRKRKGGYACQSAVPDKKPPHKPLKRRAPPVPLQNRIVSTRK